MTEEWRDAFVRLFYVYDLEKGTPAGAEKEAVEFISQQRKEAAREALEASAREIEEALGKGSSPTFALKYGKRQKKEGRAEFARELLADMGIWENTHFDDASKLRKVGEFIASELR